MSQVLIAGCGEIGTLLGLKLTEMGHEVWGLRRQAQVLPVPIHPISADLAAPETLTSLPTNINIVFYTAAANDYSDEAYHQAYVLGLKNLLEALNKQGQPIKRVYFTSSTGVYGQAKGEWVDETSPCEPTSFSGQRLLDGEELLAKSHFPSTIVRFGGIYGPGRTQLIDAVKGGSAALTPTTNYTNRIHIEDCVGVLSHLLKTKELFDVYLAVDSEPAAKNKVIAWLADQLGVPMPKGVDKQYSPQRGNKRCSNARLIASGYRFKYPTFKEGYQKLMEHS